MNFTLPLTGKTEETRYVIFVLEDTVKDFSDEEKLKVIIEIMQVCSHLKNSLEKDMQPKPFNE